MAFEVHSMHTRNAPIAYQYKGTTRAAHDDLRIIEGRRSSEACSFEQLHTKRSTPAGQRMHSQDDAIYTIDTYIYTANIKFIVLPGPYLEPSCAFDMQLREAKDIGCLLCYDKGIADFSSYKKPAQVHFLS